MEQKMTQGIWRILSFMLLFRIGELGFEFMAQNG